MGRATWGPGPNRGFEDFEAVRRQHGQRGHGGRGGPWGQGFGPPPWVLQLFGGEFAKEFGRHGRPGGNRGPRVRRGDVRSAILDVLAEEPGNGYQVIQQITERSRGAWKPSPGSVYPTISQLEDEGLVESVEDAGKRVLRLSVEGTAYVADHRSELDAVWTPFAENEGDDGDVANLKQVIGQTMSAVWQVAVTGTPEQQTAAVRILADTRRRLYGVLADGPEANETDTETDTEEE